MAVALRKMEGDVLLGIEHLRIIVIVMIARILHCNDLETDTEHLSIENSFEMEKERQHENQTNAIEKNGNDKQQHNQ